MIVILMSEAHIAPEYFSYLKKIHNKSLAAGWLAEFYDSYWGIQNGVQVATADGRRAVCIPNRFGLPQTGPIVVRETYLELWKHLYNAYLRYPLTEGIWSEATILRGPDRRLAIYFLLVAAAEARVPMVFHCTRDRWACVCVDVGTFFISHARVSTLAFKTRALVIIDAADDVPPTGGVWRANAHVVIGAPHMAEPDVALAYRTFSKQRCADYYTVTERDPEREVPDVPDLTDNMSRKTVSVITTDHAVSCSCAICSGFPDSPVI